MGVVVRKRKLSKNRISYYLDICNNGKRFTETTGVIIGENDPEKKDKLRLLDAIVAKRKHEYFSNDFDVVHPSMRKMDFFEYCDNYVNSYSGKDIRKLEGAIAKFKEYIEPKVLPMNRLSPTLCEGFMIYLTEQPELSGETPYNYWGKFKTIVNRAAREDYLSKNPVQGLRFKGRKDSKDNLSKEVLTIDELRTLKETICPNDQVKRAFLFASFTGMGLAEIRELKGKDIKNGVLKYKRKKTKRHVTFELHKSAFEQIDESYKDDDYIFHLPSDTAVNKDLKSWVNKAKIDKHITFYCARHSFATNILLQRTGSVKDVMDLLGHTSLQHTIKYVKHTNETRNKAVNNLAGL